MSARRHRQQLQRIADGDDLFAFQLDGPRPLVNLSSGWQRRKLKLQAGAVDDFGEFDSADDAPDWLKEAQEALDAANEKKSEALAKSAPKAAPGIRSSRRVSPRCRRPRGCSPPKSSRNKP